MPAIIMAAKLRLEEHTIVRDKPAPFIAMSYHFQGDRLFVAALSRELAERGVATWFLEHILEPQDYSTKDLLGGQIDWRVFPANWQALFIEHLLSANGVIVVLSPGALASRSETGRGMWRERPAIDFIRKDNPLRIKEIERPTNADESEVPEDLLEELAGWGKRVLALPHVQRSEMNSTDATAFNTPTGETGPRQLMRTKPPAAAWYDLVRLDLYDGEWHCRSCGLSSDAYVIAHYDPPASCPRCGFHWQE